MKNKICHWIQEGNSCGSCPAYEDMTTSNENGTEYDYACYAGHDDSPCRLPRMYRWLMGRRGRYYRNHQYDGFGKFAEENEASNEAFFKSLMDNIFQERYVKERYVMCFKRDNGTLHEMNTAEYIRDKAAMARYDYDDYMREHQKPLWVHVRAVLIRKIMRPWRFLWSFIGR